MANHRRAWVGLAPRYRKAFRHAGITGVLEASACDRLNVPVGVAVRPNGRVARIFDGKGATPLDAQIAAGMEAIETAVAEQPQMSATFAAAASLDGHILLPQAMPVLRDFRLDADRMTYWYRGTGLSSRRKIWAPCEMVGLGVEIDPRRRLGLPAHSTGLAAHATEDQAVVAGLLEVIERDQLARWLSRHSREGRRRLGAKSQSDELSGLLLRCDAAGMLPVLWRIDSDLEVPCVLCQLFDLREGRRRDWAMTSGVAAHPNLARASRQALLEAIQSRIALRLRAPSERPIPRPRSAWRRSVNRELAFAVTAPPGDGLAKAPRASRQSPQSILRRLVRLIHLGRGVEPVLFRLSAPRRFPHVVRIIVPGFEDVRAVIE